MLSFPCDECLPRRAEKKYLGVQPSFRLLGLFTTDQDSRPLTLDLVKAYTDSELMGCFMNQGWPGKRIRAWETAQLPVIAETVLGVVESSPLQAVPSRSGTSGPFSHSAPSYDT